MFTRLLISIVAALSSYFTYYFKMSFTNNNEQDSLSDPIVMTRYLAVSNEETLFKTDNYATYYFKNLNNNFGYNEHNSCGYVAIGMLLSFWDTYWDDNIIDEVYEKKEACSGGNNYISLDEESPGVTREAYNIYHVTYDQYMQNIVNYNNLYFHFKLISIGLNYYDHDYGNFGMTYNRYVSLINGYLFDYKSYSPFDVSVEYSNTNVRDSVISYIRQGIPVKLGIEGHAVIAYDYDENTDKIYCHFGWGSNATHVTIEEMGYSQYTNYFAIVFNNQHSHSNNYYSIDGENTIYHCPCSTICVYDIECNNMYLDYLPLFEWNRSLINEKWFDNSDYYYEVVFKKIDGTNLFTIYSVETNCVTLTMYQYQLLEIYVESTFTISVYLQTNGSATTDIYAGTSYTETMTKATRYKEKLHIKANEWGFEPRYYFFDEGIRYTQKVVNGVTISTSRLRCGYIENMFVNLSPRRYNAGYAYLELHFSVPVYSMMYGACLWSDDEQLNGYALLQTEEDGDWYTQVDLLNDITLNTKEEGVIRYTRRFGYGTTGVRFIVQSSATGDRNKGRLCLEDLVFCTSVNITDNINYVTVY